MMNLFLFFAKSGVTLKEMQGYKMLGCGVTLARGA
jgi:hypothetical protein